MSVGNSREGSHPDKHRASPEKTREVAYFSDCFEMFKKYYISSDPLC